MFKDNVKYVEFPEKDVNPSFGIFSGEELLCTEDLYIPTLRDFHVIFWLKKGTLEFSVDFQKHTFNENSIFLLSKNQVHFFEKFDKENVDLRSIAFTPEFIYRNDSDLHHLCSFDLFSHLNGFDAINLNDEDSIYLDFIYKKMEELNGQYNSSLRYEAFYHYLSLFLLHIQSKLSVDKFEISESIKNIQKFNSLLEEYFRTEYKVDFYSDAMKMNPKTLSRLVKQHFNLPPKTIIDERRVLEIKRRLKGSTDSVKTISYDMGFDEVTNMVKYFKKKTGFTPQSFREN